ncbi:hypothetical protein AB0N09_21780 [Streptomyces erythrochromogenes]|uniref:hypothetical protein n=1 Tax=Streptomyces erythrochromogenes TaxID=285574 RepID=UPI0034122B4E
MPDDRPRSWKPIDRFLHSVGETWSTVAYTRPGENLTRPRPGRAGNDGDAFDEAAAEERERRTAAAAKRAAAATSAPLG